MLTKMRMRLWILRRSAVLTCGDACPVSLREASTTSTTPRACMGMYFVSCIPCVPCRCEISVKMPDTGLTAPALAPLSQAGLAALMAHSLSLAALRSSRHGEMFAASHIMSHISSDLRSSSFKCYLGHFLSSIILVTFYDWYLTHWDVLLISQHFLFTLIVNFILIIWESNTISSSASRILIPCLVKLYQSTGRV